MRILLLAGAMVMAALAGKPKPTEMSPLDRYIAEAMSRGSVPAGATPGSAWSAASPLTDAASDVRAARLDDLVTILVVERASAVSSGTVKTSRQSDLTSGVSALGGVTRAAGPLANLAGASTQSKLDGQGSTSRETVLTTTLAARVTHVLPNGLLVVEGAKDVQVNAEQQVITVRGVVRPADLTAGNQVRSDRLAQLEIRINGKGVVNDSIRRPMFLYRLLLGILPF